MQNFKLVDEDGCVLVEMQTDIGALIDRFLGGKPEAPAAPVEKPTFKLAGGTPATAQSLVEQKVNHGGFDLSKVFPCAGPQQNVAVGKWPVSYLKWLNEKIQSDELRLKGFTKDWKDLVIALWEVCRDEKNQKQDIAKVVELFQGRLISQEEVAECST